MEKSQQPPGIKLSPQEERAITHPHLYGLALEGKEEEDAGPLQIVVNTPKPHNPKYVISKWLVSELIIYSNALLHLTRI